MISLWQFPESDFAAWCELVDSPQVASYREYLTLLAAVQAEHERHGRRVRRVHMTVAEMRGVLDECDLDNVAGNRALVIALVD